MHFDAILQELDFEKLFNALLEELHQNKADSFDVDFFTKWLRKSYRYLWRSCLIKGSPHGQKFAVEKFDGLVRSILRILLELHLIHEFIHVTDRMIYRDKAYTVINPVPPHLGHF